MLLKRKAFTLLEILLSISIFVLLASIISPIYFSTKNRDDLDTKVDSVVSLLRRAQILSMTGSHDSSWGVKILDKEVIMFKGDDFSSRDSNFDDVLRVRNGINFNGFDEIVFSRVFGRSSVLGDLEISLNDDLKVLTINEMGIISY